jgi:DNA-binding SARP family transcriptional activator
MWPEADPDAAVNSLNQTVFQLRRYIDPSYHGGESPEYVNSTTEHVGLNTDLVHTDLAEVRRLPARLAGGDWQQRQAIAAKAIKLVRGEFLADLRYEEWAGRQQFGVHGAIRESLLPIAQGGARSFDFDVAAQAAAALLTLDPFDEAAVIALADSLAQSGRRVTAQNVMLDFIRRLEADLDLGPSIDLETAAANIGKPRAVKSRLTESLPN